MSRRFSAAKIFTATAIAVNPRAGKNKMVKLKVLNHSGTGTSDLPFVKPVLELT